jgi:hypothetical protein
VAWDDIFRAEIEKVVAKMAEETAIEPAVGTSAVVTIPTISVRRQLAEDGPAA